MCPLVSKFCLVKQFMKQLMISHILDFLPYSNYFNFKNGFTENSYVNTVEERFFFLFFLALSKTLCTLVEKD